VIESPFTRVLDRIVNLRDLDATWLTVASELLRFAAGNMPSASSWAGLPPGEPHATVVVTSAVARAALAAATPNASDDSKLSFAAKNEREILRSVAIQQLAEAPFDQQMNEATTALGLAEAIDGVTGHTFMPWFKGEGELTVNEGTVYPIRELDPRQWLGANSANTRPSRLPTRELLSTSCLQVAKDVHAFTFVLDFHYWDTMSDFGGEAELIAAVGQPNTDLDDFDIKLATEPTATYANHGPIDHTAQASCVGKLIAAAGAANADIFVLPEYNLSPQSRDLLAKQLPPTDKAPRLVITGVSAGTDDDGYIINEAIMILSTPADGLPRIITLPTKIYPAQVEGFNEHLKQGFEIRLFLTQQWTIATLICFDAMDDNIIDQLAAFGTNLLLVPALSEKTATLMGSATSLCHRSQAFVVISTGPARWESSKISVTGSPEQRSEAVFAGPYATGQVAQAATSVSDGVEAGRTDLWTFSYPTREVAAHQICNS
jgi:hypothetical protein